ncbi:MAG: (Fe-S)-binding protein [Deltaproteobacteria bacterium]|nr:(Fe-S)-binding protein [Deltaproteobacteria bacterium]
MPDIGVCTHRLLRRLGVRTIYHEEQTCCGQPAIRAGFTREAKRAAKHFIETFENDEAIVSPSGSCIYTVRYYYPDLFRDEPGWLRRAEALSPRVYELSQYMVDVLGVDAVGARFSGKVTYHESCHVLRGLGVSEQPKKLIGSVQGAEFVPLNNADRCCGFGGEFANAYPDISEELVKDKVQNYLNSGADLLVLCEPGCLLNINGYLSRNHPGKRAMHIAEFLAGGAG